jgi:hypothetical protein
MNTRKVAAKFAASVWYEECRAGRQTEEETARFVKENWQAFLPVAPEGLGRLLARIAPRRSGRRRYRQVRSTRLAMAS